MGGGSSPYMKAKATSTTTVAHQLGVNQKEDAVKTAKHNPNFKQSRDVREDRSQRQAKNAVRSPDKTYG